MIVQDVFRMYLACDLMSFYSGVLANYMGVSKNNGIPKSSHVKKGFSIMFTIHFGG